jgi:shikimate kinase
LSQAGLNKKNVILVGPMGVGKTTIGRQLAKALKIPFKDSDREIEQRTGVDIPLIFELEGESGFRKRESSMIAEIVEMPGVILATGGGAVLDSDNRDIMKRQGTVIYLCADIEYLVERTSKDAKRPLLQTEDPELKIKELLAHRDPLYREVADLIVNTGGRTVKSVVKEITQHLEQDILSEK